MDLKRLLTGFVALTFITLATSQRFPTQHPFHPIPFLPEDSSSEGDFEPSHLPLERDEQQRLKTIGSLSTPTEITFDSYNAAFPAQLRPFRLENQMYWPPDQQKEQSQQQHEQLGSNCNDEKVESFLRCKSSWLQREEEIYGNGNDFDDMLYPDADDVTASIERHDDNAEKHNRINTKDPKAMFLKNPMKLWLFPFLLKDANKHQRNAGASGYNMRQSDQLKTGGKEGYEKRTLMDDFMPKTDEQQQQQLLNDDSFVKRNAFRNIKRQKSRSHDTRRFLPSISPGAMTHLGHFFKDLKSNVNFMENQRFGAGQQKLLEGDHPVALLREELLRSAEGGNPPTGETAAFLNAIRTYRPSQKIRSLVSMNPEGYHGSQFLDPNYMWVGLGK